MTTTARRGGLVLALAWAALSAAQAASAQDPFHCRPPMGQQMAELRVINASQTYREQPTPANKVRLCQALDWAVKVHADAVAYCGRSSCDEDQFREVCAKRGQKLGELRARRRADCGR